MSEARDLVQPPGEHGFDSTQSLPRLQIIIGEDQDPSGSFFDTTNTIIKLGEFAHTLLIDRHTGHPLGKAGRITAEILSEYLNCTGAESPADLQDTARNYASLANFLITNKSSNTRTAVELELIDEGVKPFDLVSPTHIAEALRKRDIQYDNTLNIVVLATKLWTLDRIDGGSEVTTNYFSALQAEWERQQQRGRRSF